VVLLGHETLLRRRFKSKTRNKPITCTSRDSISVH
jgi:hypothetical protein